MAKLTLKLGKPSPKQKKFLVLKRKYLCYGGARGGGKSWVVRFKAKLLALKYAGIRQLIVRRTYPELQHNHIEILTKELQGVAKYREQKKQIKFGNGSIIDFMYCEHDKDLDRLQGVEYDVIYLDEATQLSEHQMKVIAACCRGVNNFPKHVIFTCNPGGQGMAYIKRCFIERRFEEGEDPEDYDFVQALVTDNEELMKAQPDYIKQLQALPPKIREAWLNGSWDVFEGQFFEDFRVSPDISKCAELGITPEEARRRRIWTHVIDPFDISQGNCLHWKLYRSFDWGYSHPFSCAWWAVDTDGVLYRIMELYGCTKIPNEGVKWPVERVFDEIYRIEHEHPWLKGRFISGVADPAIWDASTGPSIAETAAKHGVHFVPGDHQRIPGWMQCHYRLTFNPNGRPNMYVFSNCKGFIRTIPLLMYDDVKPEDIDTEMEDHIADEWRYMCMARPMAAIEPQETPTILADPLDQFK